MARERNPSLTELCEVSEIKKQALKFAWRRERNPSVTGYTQYVKWLLS